MSTTPRFLRSPAIGPCDVPSYRIWHGVAGRLFGSLHGLSVWARDYRRTRFGGRCNPDTYSPEYGRLGPCCRRVQRVKL